MQIKLERFEGPLDLLLQLIEKEEMSITEVSLANVTEQYLQFLDEHPNIAPDELADFLVVAAKLLLIKSRVLLPSLFVDDGEDTGDSLAHDLEVYRRYVEASRVLSERLRSRQFLFARERAIRADTVTFSPPPSLTNDGLRATFEAILKDLNRYVKPAPELISRTLSLQEKITAMRSLMQGERQLDFRRVLANAKDRVEVIVSFLALLELIKQRYVVASQDGHGDTIVVTRFDVADEAADDMSAEPLTNNDQSDIVIIEDASYDA